MHINDDRLSMVLGRSGAHSEGWHNRRPHTCTGSRTSTLPSGAIAPGGFLVSLSLVSTTFAVDFSNSSMPFSVGDCTFSRWGGVGNCTILLPGSVADFTFFRRA